jgi:photosystem II stability/assembly factor-like uncharacterized protein
MTTHRRLIVLLIVSVAALAIAPAARAAGWTAQKSGTTQMLFSVDFVDSQHGWAVGDSGTILSTSNAGATWTVATWPSSATGLAGVDFVDAQHGWISGLGGLIAVTADGGVTWAAQFSGVLTDLSRIRFADLQHGWVVGDAGVILHTADGGATWGPQTLSGTPSDLVSIDAVSQQEAWTVGFDGCIAHTADGGATWTRQASGTTKELFGVDFIDAQHGWVGGNGIILATADGGATWTKQSGGGVWQYLAFFDVAMTGPQSGSLAGSWGLMGSTTNAGVTWDGQLLGENDLFGLSFAGRQHGWAVGGGGTIFCTWAPESSVRLTPAPNAAGWNRTPVIAVLSSKTMGGYSVAGMDYRLASGPWLPATAAGAGWQSALVTQTGVTQLSYRGTDNAGNVEDPLAVAVRIDTVRPVLKALAKATVKKGRTATLRFRVTDVCPTCAVTIDIRNAKGKRVKRLTVPTAPTNTATKATFTCALSKGIYTWKLSARDLAGNKQAKVVSGKLRVR